MHVSYLKDSRGYLTGMTVEDPSGEIDQFFVRAALAAAANQGFTQEAILPAHMVAQRNAYRLAREGKRVSITFFTRRTKHGVFHRC